MNETAALRLILALSFGTASCVMLGLPLMYVRHPKSQPTENATVAGVDSASLLGES